MKTIYQILLTMFCLLLGSQAFAQVELRLQPVRKDFIVGENVALKLTIINQTDASISLKNAPDRPWLNFSVTKRGEQAPVSPIATAR
ncbi:MAG: hypothetical protein IKW19_01215, partial [Akkermansia sp.]|nr:hypothetical protein [Akkermansia sp.]